MAMPLSTPTSSAAHTKHVRSFRLRDRTPSRRAQPAQTHGNGMGLRGGGSGRRPARVENRTKRDGVAAANERFRADYRCWKGRKEGEGWCEDQPVQRDAAEGQKRGENNDGNASDGHHAAGCSHRTFHSTCILLRAQEAAGYPRAASPAEPLAAKPATCLLVQSFSARTRAYSFSTAGYGPDHCVT